MQGTILARGCAAAAAVSGEDLDPVQRMQAPHQANSEYYKTMRRDHHL